ncbi:hypothetical protein QFC22_004713 [Naganishia vaughanmartiniae]|uniref:Uncharacterized protein n=1 Tax=Naganishia vaughanmartiniae TaxID=1424756 RepID=A0ACC2WZ28_9TREE|nr:hypothetical protein QFC22_004713 [Naganishia vaughanmartiniae]
MNIADTTTAIPTPVVRMRCAVHLLKRTLLTSLPKPVPLQRYQYLVVRSPLLNPLRTMSTAESAAQPNAQPVATTSQEHNAGEAAQVAVEKKPQGVAKPKKEKKSSGDAGTVTELNPPPEFFAKRNAIFDKYKKEYEERIAALPRQQINITLPDGKVVEGMSWETTPFKVAEGIAKSLAERVIISKVSCGRIRKDVVGERRFRYASRR